MESLHTQLDRLCSYWLADQWYGKYLKLLVGAILELYVNAYNHAILTVALIGSESENGYVLIALWP